MSEMRIRVCDRCGKPAGDPTRAATTPAAAKRLTRHGHHDRFIDLCAACDGSFDAWLGEMGATRDGLPLDQVADQLQRIS